MYITDFNVCDFLENMCVLKQGLSWKLSNTANVVEAREYCHKMKTFDTRSRIKAVKSNLRFIAFVARLVVELK